MTEQAAVFYANERAGVLSKIGNHYRFIYDSAYVNRHDSLPISVSIPLQSDPYEFDSFPPFFDGLLPEGWLLELESTKYKINRGDKFALLLAVGENCIGAVHIEPMEPIDD